MDAHAPFSLKVGGTKARRRDMEGKKGLALLVAAWAIATIALVAALFTRSSYEGPANTLKIDLARPDVLVQSRQLAALPRDLVALPGLRDVLTRDFVEYYEEHPDRLTLEGTLRRLAYEHGLSWQERLVASVLDAPAEVALWSDGKGRLTYAALLLEKNAAAQALEQVAKVALPESQLTRAGTVEVDGALRTVYALQLRSELTLLFVSSGSRLLVLTHPGMLLDADRQPAGGPAHVASALLRTGDASWRGDFELPALPPATRHAITARASWLSFGYQHFFPQVHAVRLDLGEVPWSLSLAAAPGVWNDWPRSAALAWSALPRGAAFCAALPVTWERASEPLATVLGAEAPAFAADLQPGAGVCWYPANGLYAPVLALQFKPGTGGRHDTQLRTLVAKSAPKIKDREREVAVRDVPAGKLWTTDVATASGYLPAGGSRVYRLGVLRQGDVVLASVDHRALEQAQAVQARKYPALADDFAGGPLLLTGLAESAQLLQAESLRLTADTPVFRELVRKQLKPRLDAMANGGRLAFAAPAGGGTSGRQWTWQTLVPANTAGR
jgi:uncharacterized protein YfaA (DUF2138 family)